MMKRDNKTPVAIATVAALMLCASAVLAGGAAFKSKAPAQLRSVTTTGKAAWDVLPLITIGEQGAAQAGAIEQALGYRPVGRLDGIAAFPVGTQTLRVLVNHELKATRGYPYTLENGTRLTGARVSYFDIDTADHTIRAAGPAYRRVLDRGGTEVTAAAQINEGLDSGGFASLCSAHGVRASTSEFVNDLYFTGEEVAEYGVLAAKGFGGQAAVLDIDRQTAYVVPMLGRAAFENVVNVPTGSRDKVALLIGDDRQAGPLYLYLGRKGGKPASGYQPPELLVRNGLGLGRLYVWVADSGERTPDRFHGTGEQRRGHFVRIEHFNPAFAGLPNYDALGFASLAVQDIRAATAGGFMFSRPEDIAVNPANGAQFVLASTGRGGLFPADTWGTIYRVDLSLREVKTRMLAQIERIPATLTILYDADDAGGKQFPGPDFGLRSPDNLDWGDDGFIYIQEDRASLPDSLFGGASGKEAAVWRMHPQSGKLTRMLEIDRSAVPAGQTDTRAGIIGAWESSGIVDVSEFFNDPARKTTAGPQTVLLMTVQAHGTVGGGLARYAAQASDLVEGGQLLLVISRSRQRE